MIEEFRLSLKKTAEMIRERWDERFERAFWNCCAMVALNSVEGISSPIMILIIGPSSSGKSTLLSLFREAGNIVWLDDFTPKSFVSHVGGVKEEKLAKIDLLPKLKDKCLIISDLAPLFSQPAETLTQSIGIITRVLDGHGLMTTSGVRGIRGYSGSYIFTWLAASTPIGPHVWVKMSKAGSRMLFQKINGIETFSLENIEDFPVILNIMRNGVTGAFSKLFARGARTVREDEISIPDGWHQKLFFYSTIVSKLRPAPVFTYASRKEKAELTYVDESPMRVFTQLKELTKGLNLALGDDYETIEKCIMELVAGSVPHLRHEFLRKLISQEKEEFTIKDIFPERRSCSSTQDHFDTFVAMKLLKKEEDFKLTGEKGRPSVTYKKLSLLRRLGSEWAEYFN